MNGQAHISKLSLVRSELPDGFASSWTESHHTYLEFEIDGIALRALLGDVRTVGAGALGWMESSEDDRVAATLIGQPSILETGRAELYTCPECGHIGCGSITAVVEIRGGLVIWRDFGLERDWDDPQDGFLNLECYRDIGPFVFVWSQYCDTITARGSL